VGVGRSVGEDTCREGKDFFDGDSSEAIPTLGLHPPHSRSPQDDGAVNRGRDGRAAVLSTSIRFSIEYS
jgi:hypothetical protein